MKAIINLLPAKDNLINRRHINILTVYTFSFVLLKWKTTYTSDTTEDKNQSQNACSVIYSISTAVVVVIIEHEGISNYHLICIKE